MEKIEKPTILKIKEAEEEIIKIINNSKLPAFILKPIIEKILRQIEILEEQELINETNNYNEALNNEKESDK